MSTPSPYQPAQPADAPMVTPRRPRFRTTILWVAVVVVLVGSALLSLTAITRETGLAGLVTGSVLAAVPVFPVVAAFLWLDRYEAEPPPLLALAFAWGAGVSTFGALVINTASMVAIHNAGGDMTHAAVFVAPVVEEAFKGAAVLLILLMRRREFDGVVDGIVYAGMAGIGFAYVENVLYLGRTLADAESGGGGTAFVFILRCVVSPFAHPLFTAAIGVGIGMAVRTRTPALRVLAPLAGYLVAVLLHGVWNWSASSGLAGFASAYVVLQVPVFLAFIALALVARRREGKLVAQHLDIYGRTGWLTQAEVAMLASLPARREARSWALRTGGSEARRAMRDFQELGSELAFLRERMARGTAAPDAPNTEYAMLATLSTLRSRFLPRMPHHP
ncbi:PrsW family intramembrane metalloprotease [Kineosporia babensis]|uniref:PrsW family intramembrane metalloprotease n=1 Tax=Kineosporia babensis TaxID=499548 RepID=A0A9X1NDY8_9ACTN|nr:PrsW family intramembrane metalloprotease [Kineosporia babensis]